MPAFDADFSAESLTAMAEHVRKNIPDLIAFDASENEDFVLGAVAYLG